jgi:magnesium chelatase subunit D
MAEGQPLPPASGWSRALEALALFAVDPFRLGGLRVVAKAGPVRERFLREAERLLGGIAPLRRLPPLAGEDALTGGLDLAETLRAGRPILRGGLLTAPEGAILVAPMAERLAPMAAGVIAAAIDDGVVRVERDGVGSRTPTRIALLLLDESEDGEAPPSALVERAPVTVMLEGVGVGEALGGLHGPDAVAAARAALARTPPPDARIAEAAAAAEAFGVASIRRPMAALRLARCAAAIAGRGEIADADLAAGILHAILPAATRAPAREADPQPPPAEPPGTDDAPNGDAPENEPPAEASTPPEAERADGGPPEDATGVPDGAMADRVVAAALARMPPDILERLAARGRLGASARGGGRKGDGARAGREGRPAGATADRRRSSGRLALIATLTASAPWQRLRRASPAFAARPAGVQIVLHGDLRFVRRKLRRRGATIFVVDASGSSALNRLSEAKGAVELLLAESYVRRDEVALIAFRGRAADCLLPPTRSLARTKRRLAGLPGGGGTPLASGLSMAADVAAMVERRGDVPKLVLLTDGQANVALDGAGGRARAMEDATAMARRIRAAGFRAVVIDTSARPNPAAAALAEAMGARYAPLPQARAAAVKAAVAGV